MMKSAVYANYSPKEKSERTQMGTMWPMQTLGSFDLLYWKKPVIRNFYATTARVISTEIMLSLLIFNKMTN
jgi:hypothetical protein